MLEFGDINLWAVVVAWLINVVVGAYWYSPAGFGKQWTMHTGVDHMKMPENEATKAISFIALSALLNVFTLAVVVRSLNATTALEGFSIGVLLWLGLTAATAVGNNLYQRRSWSFLWLNCSYFLLVMTINAALFAIWQ